MVVAVDFLIERFHLLEPSQYNYLSFSQVDYEDIDDGSNFKVTQVS
jgi:hypothetical protein